MYCQHAVCTSASDRTLDSSTADTYVRRMSGQQQSGLHLFRRLARAAVAIPSRPVGRKVLFNLRELFLLYRHERDSSVLATLREDAAAALRVLTWLRSLAEASPRPSHLCRVPIAGSAGPCGYAGQSYGLINRERELAWLLTLAAAFAYACAELYTCAREEPGACHQCLYVLAQEDQRAVFQQFIGHDAKQRAERGRPGGAVPGENY